VRLGRDDRPLTPLPTAAPVETSAARSVRSSRSARAGPAGARQPSLRMTCRRQAMDGRCTRVDHPLPDAGALASERLEVPDEDRVSGEELAKGLAVPVADEAAVDESGDGSAHEPLQGDPPSVVEGDDELGSTERFVEPLAVRGVEDPFGSLADVVDDAALLLRGHLDPAGLPGQVVDGMPSQAGDAGQARG